jgi:signal transduction histidine kinase
LNNIIKHSEASQASVTIKRHDQMIELTIQDNGRGFTPGVRQESANGSGFGLLGLNERARILGGMLTVTSAPGHGTITNLKLHLSSLSSL